MLGARTAQLRRGETQRHWSVQSRKSNREGAREGANEDAAALSDSRQRTRAAQTDQFVTPLTVKSKRADRNGMKKAPVFCCAPAPAAATRKRVSALAEGADSVRAPAFERGPRETRHRDAQTRVGGSQ